MRCANIEEYFSAWRDGTITDDLKDQLVTHLAHCPKCADAWASYNEALDALQTDEVVVPDSFRKGWRDRVVAAEGLPRKRKDHADNRFARSFGFRGGGMLPKLAAAAVLIGAIGLSVVIGNSYRSQPLADHDGVYGYNKTIAEDQAAGLMADRAPMTMMEAEPFGAGAGAGEGANLRGVAPQSSIASGNANQAFSKAAAPLAAPLLAQQRKIIRTAQVTIETSAVEETCNRIEMLAASFGGYVQQSSIRRNTSDPDPDNPDSEERLSGNVQIAVPSEMFDQILSQLPDLGKVLHKNVSGQDVTEEFVDLEARLKNWRSQEDQLNLIMTKARNVEEILAVQNELGRVREEIERLTGRLQYLQRRTDFSDIYFAVVAPGNEQDDAAPSPFIEALRRLGRQLWDSVAGLLAFIVTVTPWIAFAVLIFLVGRSWWRKRDL
ncbi:MAG TPA: hypothetical protein DCY84_05910 [Firmicutes bacterium]|jgi:hypothetical protein|nr:hypothetical protein [Bacillota bacterium]HAZ21880.1 hypothetical protein [Bacillota bacterium]HBL49034.1 hypothetical protein [Bacillota bacterium]HBL69147.1 hypothetical protein [Bacillota bacterium]HBR23709.1 hypothetical protein [Bacillota bacterium]